MADILRIRHWDEKRPDDRTKWRTQHDPLLALAPPYVYHVVSLTGRSDGHKLTYSAAATKRVWKMRSKKRSITQ